MYAYVKGILAAIHPTYVIVDVQGVGYSLFIPCRLIGELPEMGQSIQLFTSFVVRESSQALYGFLSHHERDLFEMLINVSGIGPKMALSLIGHLTLHELQNAVVQQDIKTLCRVPGIGKKTSERLIVELKDKFIDLIPVSQTSLAIPVSDEKAKQVQDAMLALMNLGYNQNVAQKAVKQSLNHLSENADLALLITMSLKNIKD